MEQEFTERFATVAPTFASGDARSDSVPDAPAEGSAVAADESGRSELDLDAIETDLADVEIALARLESGTYWTCEVRGAPLDDELLAAHPTARRAAGTPARLASVE
jgi:DnaK suppressor protein